MKYITVTTPKGVNTYSDEYLQVTKRMADEIDAAYIAAAAGGRYNYIVFDEVEPELTTEGWSVKEWPSLDPKVRDPKLEQTLQKSYQLATLRGSRSEMKRLEQQMKRNRC